MKKRLILGAIILIVFYILVKQGYVPTANANDVSFINIGQILENDGRDTALGDLDNDGDQPSDVVLGDIDRDGDLNASFFSALSVFFAVKIQTIY